MRLLWRPPRRRCAASTPYKVSAALSPTSCKPILSLTERVSFSNEKATMPVRAANLPMLLLLATQGLARAQETEFKPIVTRSVAANRIAETPDYADAFRDDDHRLDFGLESRTRYEYRWNDYNTPSLITDDALVTRNLLYFAVKGPLDPLRIGLELEDSRRFLNESPQNPNIETGFEILQAFAQLHFEDVIGGQALNFGFGRWAFDFVDRRLVARNRNRNAINAFDGFRLRLGDETTPWEIDAFATRPVERLIDRFDISTNNATLVGLSGHWRSWSPHAVLEPWWLWFDQNDNRGTPIQRNLHSFGLHAFGQWGASSAWDYDISLAGQLGSTQGQDHRAWAAHIEAGHTWSSAWKPRLALWLNYASGDRNPNDNRQERFDPIFGATYAFYGFTGYFAWQNVVNPALRLSFQPLKNLRCELFQRAFWLASDTDAWVRGLRRDETGASGAFIGQETDARLVWQVGRHFEIDLAYTHFFPGAFVSNTGRAPPGDFVQIAGTLRF